MFSNTVQFRYIDLKIRMELIKLMECNQTNLSTEDTHICVNIMFQSVVYHYFQYKLKNDITWIINLKQTRPKVEKVDNKQY